jgi:ribosomal protein S18 acetylase RimI-like enzyme
MKIRQAAQDDAKTLASLIFSSAPTTLIATFEINSTLSVLNFLQSNLSTEHGQYGYANHWVAEIDNQIVGCVSAWHTGLLDSFHQATLSKLTGFYGITHTLSVVHASLALTDCIPKPKKHEWCIGHFAVNSQYQRKGIGSALLGFMQEQALDFKKSELCLDVESSNIQALNFYLGQGFVKNSESIVSPRMQTLGIGTHLHLSKQLI